jgi:hypothetical protein
LNSLEWVEREITIDLGSDPYLVIALALPLIAILVMVLLQRQKVKTSRNARWAGIIIGIAIIAIYMIWNSFYR